MAALSERLKIYECTGNMYPTQIMDAIRLLETNVRKLDNAYERYIYGMHDLKSLRDLLEEIESLRIELGLDNGNKS